MRKLNIKTAKIQSMLNKVIRCAGNNKFNVLTNLIRVKLENNVLSMTTTDVNNYFTVYSSEVSGDDLEFVVPVDTFSKLISKTNVEDVRISVADDVISITGNGTYKIPIQLDVSGEPINYPECEINIAEDEGSLKISAVKNIILHNKNSLAVTDEKPCLRGYYIADGCVVSADSYNICKNDVPTFETVVLVSPVVFDLLSLCKEDEVSYKIADNNILFESDSIKLFAHLMNGKDDYVEFYNVVKECAETEFESNCALPKTALLNALDRLSLFIKDNDINCISMTFTKSGVKLETADYSAIEDIPYQSSENFNDFTCKIGVDHLKKQLSSIVGETVHIYYGNDRIVTIKQDNAIHMISLL